MRPRLHPELCARHRDQLRDLHLNTGLEHQFGRGHVDPGAACAVIKAPCATQQQAVDAEAGKLIAPQLQCVTLRVDLFHHPDLGGRYIEAGAAPVGLGPRAERSGKVQPLVCHQADGATIAGQQRQQRLLRGAPTIERLRTHLAVLGLGANQGASFHTVATPLIPRLVAAQVGRVAGHKLRT